MKHIFEIVLLLLILMLPLMFWGESIISNAEEITAQSKPSEETTEKLPDGGILGKTRITSAAFFEKDQYALSDLTEEGKKLLQEFTKKILVAKTDYAERYAGLSIVLTITTTCYEKPPLATLRAKTINEYFRQLLSEHDRVDLKLKIKYKIGESPKETSEEKQRASETDYDISAELRVKERGPRVSHPTEIILYEVIEE
jgi:hypothetical protein